MSDDRKRELFQQLYDNGRNYIDQEDHGIELDGRWTTEEIPMLIEWLQIVLAENGEEGEG